MIGSETEYQMALARLKEDRDFTARQRSALEALGLTPEQVEKGMEPLFSFHAQLEEEVEWYEKVRRRDFAPIQRLSEIGRILIALRIANGLSQKELAEKLDVSEASVSRDEKNEYHNITVERAQRILDALHERVITTVQPPLEPGRQELAVVP
jgi:DNA-directed RNA polymerase specialized sigma subunit